MQEENHQYGLRSLQAKHGTHILLTLGNLYGWGAITFQTTFPKHFWRYNYLSYSKSKFTESENLRGYVTETYIL